MTSSRRVDDGVDYGRSTTTDIGEREAGTEQRTVHYTTERTLHYRTAFLFIYLFILIVLCMQYLVFWISDIGYILLGNSVFSATS